MPPCADEGRTRQAPAPRDGERLPDFIPAVTDDDRKAAFPQLQRLHHVHERALQALVLFDHLEWRAGGRVPGA